MSYMHVYGVIFVFFSRVLKRTHVCSWVSGVLGISRGGGRKFPWIFCWPYFNYHCL